MPSATERAREVLENHGGTLRTGGALAAGIHLRTLYAMRDGGRIEQLARGLFRLAGLPPLGEPDLATVARRVPHAWRI
ncbi:MAG: type IV toxin-antitoxin system AbiEi family antitoxin domain-containing protein [Planctomycetes bacterium]|nr:type IV toxin-antitoxin system AbiEi family antitoxin domain-containing protein [Planctomycetota bacterium]